MINIVDGECLNVLKIEMNGSVQLDGLKPRDESHLVQNQSKIGKIKFNYLKSFE